MREVIVFCPGSLHRSAWTALLEKQPGISTVFSVGTLPELKALSFPENQTPIFIDLAGIDAVFVSQITAVASKSGLLILVKDIQVEQAVSLLQAGATGLINHDASVSELVKAINAVRRGEVVLPAEIASQVMLALARGGGRPQRSIESLTDREQEVLSLLAQGFTNKDIAQSLFLSVRTIEAHLRNIYIKLDINSRTEAVLWAVQHGYEP